MLYSNVSDNKQEALDALNSSQHLVLPLNILSFIQLINSKQEGALTGNPALPGKPSGPCNKHTQFKNKHMHAHVHRNSQAGGQTSCADEHVTHSAPGDSCPHHGPWGSSELCEVEDALCDIEEQLLAEDGISELAFYVCLFLCFFCFECGLTSCRLVTGPGGPGGPGGPEMLCPSSPLLPLKTLKGLC